MYYEELSSLIMNEAITHPVQITQSMFYNFLKHLNQLENYPMRKFLENLEGPCHNQ